MKKLKKIFIGATRQNDGNTVLSLGLIGGFKSRVGKTVLSSLWGRGDWHIDVESVFDFSNAKVAHLLKSKVIMISSGGMGMPIEDIILSVISRSNFSVERQKISGFILSGDMLSCKKILKEAGKARAPVLFSRDDIIKGLSGSYM